MKKLCDRCGGNVRGGISQGGAYICRPCSVDIQPEIDALRAYGRPVNILQIARKYYKETCSGGNYYIRDIPTDLLDTWKRRAVADGCNQRDVVLAALVEYLG